MNWGFNNHILWMAIAAVLAVSIGILTTKLFDTTKIGPDVVQLIGLIGDLWLRSLRAIVLPLIFTNMVVAAHSLSKIPQGAKKIASHTLTYYLITTILSCVEGLLISYFFVLPFVQPIDLSKLPQTISDLSSSNSAELTIRTPLQQVMGIFTSLIPTNVFASFAENDFMGVIVTGLVIGFLIRNEKKSPILAMCVEVEGFVTRVIAYLISVAPIGVFFLILPNLMVLDIAEVGKFVGIYILASIGGCFFHLLVIYPIIFLCVAKRSPVPLFLQSIPSLITAFGTSSSAATLPVTMQVAKAYGIPDHIAKFSINLGTTCNMDGAAIGFPIAVIFQGAALGIQFSFMDCVLIVLTSAVAAIGASPIPSAGLVLILMVMSSVKVPATALFGLIISVDFVVDRFQTALNVMGDLMCSSIVWHINPDIELNDDIVEYEEKVTHAHLV